MVRIALAFTSFVAAHAYLPLQQVETTTFKPAGWRLGEASSPESTIELTFAVKQRGVNDLHDALMRVSKPSSPEYGRHLTNEEVHEMTAPDPGHISAVMQFMKEHGAEPRHLTPNGDMISALVSVKTAETMLNAKYFQHHHPSGVEISRVLDSYSLPRDVAAAVDFVSPTVHLPGVRQPKQHANVSGLVNVNTPNALRELYSIDVEGKAASNKQAVTAFLEQGYGAGSLKEFWSTFCSGITCGKGDVKLVGDKTVGSGTESMLDIETITGVAGNIESEFWGFAGRSPDNSNNEPFMKWLAQMSNTSDDEIPKIFSTSYGEDEGSWSLEAATRLNVEFQKAGARGITLLYAAGDEGANCKGGVFVPEGPGSSPFVTAVGGTQPASGFPKPGSESAVGLSSGGFSNYWEMPDYQKDAVAAYLKNDGLPDAGKRQYNISGRAYPDISAQASDFVVIVNRLPMPGVAGTSCASPTAAGVFSLLNDLRLQHGQSTLGFLNPMIYENAAAFNDVTTGASGGCSGDGWPAKQGWDAVTGHGTPNYSKLAQVVSKLPSGRSQVVV